MVRGVLQNYIKASPKTGRLSYRRRIPTKLKQHFTKPDGSLRGLEWNEKLETKSISVALKKAAMIDDRFERTKAMATQLLTASVADNELSQKQRLENVISGAVEAFSSTGGVSGNSASLTCELVVLRQQLRTSGRLLVASCIRRQ